MLPFPNHAKIGAGNWSYYTWRLRCIFTCCANRLHTLVAAKSKGGTVHFETEDFQETLIVCVSVFIIPDCCILFTKAGGKREQYGCR